MKLLIFVLVFLKVLSASAEMPIIVISPSKTEQTLSSVGSSIDVIDNKTLLESSENFIGNVLDFEINGSNFSRQGGVGTNSIIQIRGLPKRYTNVYLDGVKLSDPSSPDNAFYFNNLTSESINSLEVIKGNQSSIYGSGAIAGAINIFSKNGNKPNENFINLNTDTNNTKNLSLGFGKKFSKQSFYFSANQFLTDGISAMSDNEEKDKYKKKNFHLNHNFKLNSTYELESNFRYINSFLNYDEVTSGREDNNNTRDETAIMNITLTNNKGKLENKYIYNNYYTRRKVSNYNNSSLDYYYGERHNINYLGKYNFNLDKKIIFGIENEFTRANFNSWATSGNKISDENIHSTFFDINLRNSKKLNTTIGFRNDFHSLAGSYQTGRATFAYMKDKDTKIRGGVGNGIRFGSLNDYYYDTNLQNKENLKPEKSISLDFGIDKNFDFINLNSSLTFFYNKYDNNISNWASNKDNGNSYVIKNSSGKITSKGVEFSNKLKLDKNYSIKYNHTFTLAYDGEDCDDPDKPSTSCKDSKYPVRIPKHSMGIELVKKSKNLSNKLQMIYKSSRRDYGNANNSFKDVILDDYIVINLKNDYNLFNKNFFINFKNIFNEKYEDAYQYSPSPRKLEIGIKNYF